MGLLAPAPPSTTLQLHSVICPQRASSTRTHLCTSPRDMGEAHRLPVSMTCPASGMNRSGGQFQAGKRVDILTNLNGVPGPGTYNLPSTCLKECNMMPKFGSRR